MASEAEANWKSRAEKAEVALYETNQWLNNAERKLESLGYRRCDIAACNCHSYHDWELIKATEFLRRDAQ